MASTNAQEESVRTVERAFKKAGANIVGGTTIGKHPQTVILDVFHHGSNIYIDSDGKIEIGDEEYCSATLIADKIKEIKAQRLLDKQKTADSILQ